MNRLLFLAALIAAILLTGCGGGENTDTLLRSVPASSPAVAVINIETMLRDAGVDVADGHAEIPDSLRSLLGDLPLADDGFDCTSAVAFHHDGRFVVTFRLNEAAKMERYYSSRRKATFADDGEFRVSSDGHMVLSETQGWWSAGTISVGEIRKFLKLEEKESAVSCGYAESLMSPGAGLHCVCTVNSLALLTGSPEGALKTQAALSLIFDAPAYIVSDIRFLPGCVEATGMVLDDKCMPASTAMKFKTIDIRQLSASGLRGDAFIAMNPDSESVGKLLDRYGAISGIPSGVVKSLRSLSGDMAMGVSFVNTYPMFPTFDFFATFIDAGAAAEAGDFISGLTNETGKVRAEGKVLRIDTGTPSGLPISDVADRFDGSVAGAWLSQEGMRLVYPAAWCHAFGEASVMLRPLDKTLRVEVRLGTTPGRNAAISLLEAIASGKKEIAEREAAVNAE